MGYLISERKVGGEGTFPLLDWLGDMAGCCVLLKGYSLRHPSGYPETLRTV